MFGEFEKDRKFEKEIIANYNYLKLLFMGKVCLEQSDISFEMFKAFGGISALNQLKIAIEEGNINVKQNLGLLLLKLEADLNELENAHISTIVINKEDIPDIKKLIDKAWMNFSTDINCIINLLSNVPQCTLVNDLVQGHLKVKSKEI